MNHDDKMGPQPSTLELESIELTSDNSGDYAGSFSNLALELDRHLESWKDERFHEGDVTYAVPDEVQSKEEEEEEKRVTIVSGEVGSPPFCCSTSLSLSL